MGGEGSCGKHSATLYESKPNAIEKMSAILAAASAIPETKGQEFNCQSYVYAYPTMVSSMLIPCSQEH